MSQARQLESKEELFRQLRTASAKKRILPEAYRDQPDYHLSYGHRMPSGPTSLRSGDTPPADLALRSAASPPPPRERRPPRKRYPVPPGYPPGSAQRRAGAGPGAGPSDPGPAAVRSPRS